MTELQLTELVHNFYGRVREDETLGPVFSDAIADWPHHLGKMVDFWSSVMLTSGRYKGRPLPAHIKHSDRIPSAAFDCWLALWTQTTNELFEPEPAAALQDKAERIAESLQLGIAFARGDGLRRQVGA
jgi:hemoglobin